MTWIGSYRSAQTGVQNIIICKKVIFGIKFGIKIDQIEKKILYLVCLKSCRQNLRFEEKFPK